VAKAASNPWGNRDLPFNTFSRSTRVSTPRYIDTEEKDKLCREKGRAREKRDSEIVEGCLGVRPCWSFHYGRVVFVRVWAASSVWCGWISCSVVSCGEVANWIALWRPVLLAVVCKILTLSLPLTRWVKRLVIYLFSTECLYCLQC